MDVPELEVLRLTRSTRGSYHNIFVGLSALLLSIVFVLLFFILPGPTIYWPLLWIAIPFVTYAFMLIVQGSWQLHRTLNPKSTKTAVASTQPVLPATAVTTALPPARPGMSITEATTDLLSASDRRVAEPVERKDRTTAEMNAEGLM
jgi:hypothetical protein